jgi:farnesyl-diphosphate farnesyltransferase
MSDDIQALLLKTSRTFALTIPFLPDPTRREVEVAYLLFRIIDTFEDATAWPADRRREALARVPALLEQEPRAARALAEELAAACTREPPVEHEGYRQLLARIPVVTDAHAALSPGAQASIRRHLARSAQGMSDFVARMDARGRLTLASMDDLRAYCYSVAGIVGEMLTELFLLDRPELARIAPELHARAARFGEALQLVNILKDARADAADGRVYLPPAVPLDDVFALAQEALAEAGRYTEVLHAAGAERGLVAFNALIVNLARATCRALRREGPGAKLSRAEVAGIISEVAREPDPRFVEL